MANLCEQTDADVDLVAKGMGLDERIGPRFLQAGLGYGGSCFPKDVRALIKIGEDLGVNLDLLKEVDKINTARVGAFVGKMKKALWILKDKKIAVLGLAFKPDTDDIRNAPSIPLIQALLEEEAVLSVYDPKAADNMMEVYPESEPKIQYASTPYQAAENANALLIVTDWEEFKNLDLNRIKENMANPIIVDGRNIFDPGKVRSLGFEYYSVGRK